MAALYGERRPAQGLEASDHSPELLELPGFQKPRVHPGGEFAVAPGGLEFQQIAPLLLVLRHLVANLAVGAVLGPEARLYVAEQAGELFLVPEGLSIERPLKGKGFYDPLVQPPPLVVVEQVVVGGELFERLQKPRSLEDAAAPLAVEPELGVLGSHLEDEVLKGAVILEIAL